MCDFLRNLFSAVYTADQKNFLTLFFVHFCVILHKKYKVDL